MLSTSDFGAVRMFKMSRTSDMSTKSTLNDVLALSLFAVVVAVVDCSCTNEIDIGFASGCHHQRRREDHQREMKPESQLTFKKKHQKNLCPFQVDLPENLGAVRILVDVVANSALSAGQQSALVYAAPGASIDRRAEYRYHAGEGGDVACTINNPVGGLWTIGLLAQCIDAICFATPVSNTNNYNVRISVIPLDAALRPHFVLENGRKTGYIELAENQWAYFSFRLTSPAKVWFRPNFVTLIGNVVHIVARRTTTTDLASGTGGLPTETDMGFGVEIKDVDFEAGVWVIGVWVTTSRSSVFDTLFGFGTQPKEDDATNYPVRMPANYCPDEDAPAEQGTWDECKSLACGDCVSSFGKSKGCVFCGALFGSGSCKRDTTCGINKQLTMASQCEACKGLACEACTGADGCSFCDTSNVIFTTKTCLVGKCKTPQDDLSGTCSARTIPPVVVTAGTDGATTVVKGGTIGSAPMSLSGAAPPLQAGTALAAAAAVAAAAAAAVVQ
jgi:hypothetical protein